MSTKTNRFACGDFIIDSGQSGTGKHCDDDSCIFCYHSSTDIEEKLDILKIIYALRQSFDAWKIGCETLINGIQDRIHSLEIEIKLKKFKAERQKRPHKCPACEGMTKIQIIPINRTVIEPFEKRIIDSEGRHFIECNSCEGKGIVWG